MAQDDSTSKENRPPSPDGTPTLERDPSFLEDGTVPLSPEQKEVLSIARPALRSLRNRSNAR